MEKKQSQPAMKTYELFGWPHSKDWNMKGNGAALIPHRINSFRIKFDAFSDEEAIEKADEEIKKRKKLVKPNGTITAILSRRSKSVKDYRPDSQVE